MKSVEKLRPTAKNFCQEPSIAATSQIKDTAYQRRQKQKEGAQPQRRMRLLIQNPIGCRFEEYKISYWVQVLANSIFDLKPR
jgi:hypothetical protein